MNSDIAATDPTPAQKPASKIRVQLVALLAPFRKLIEEVGKFGTVGLISFVIDIGLFNVLLYLDPAGWFHGRPMTAKAIAVIVATTISYFLNRRWTYADRTRQGAPREYTLFIVFNGIALLIALATLWFSHYALGLTSPLADNISANVIGIGLGIMFRFWAYRTFVFPEEDTLEAVGEIDVAFIEPRPEEHAHQEQMTVTGSLPATRVSV